VEPGFKKGHTSSPCVCARLTHFLVMNVGNVWPGVLLISLIFLSFFARDWGQFTPGPAREPPANAVQVENSSAPSAVPSPASSTGLRVATPSTTTTATAGDGQTAMITPAACRQPAAPCKDCSAQDHAARVRACLEALQPPPVHFPGNQTPRIGLLDGSGFVSDEGAWGGAAGVVKGKLPPTVLRRRNVTPADVCLPGAPLQCLNSTGWLELPPPLSQSGPLGLAELQRCFSGKHIVFMGDSISRYIAWALVDVVGGFQFRQSFRGKKVLWGSHPNFLTNKLNRGAWGGEPIRMHIDPIIYKHDKQENVFLEVPGLGLNVSFISFVLQAHEKFKPESWVDRSIREFGSAPSLIVYSVGLRSITDSTLASHRATAANSLRSLRLRFPSVPILHQTKGASVDQLRPGGYGGTQSQERIAAHSIETALGAADAGAAVFDILSLQSSPEALNATLDGIHFLIGTGVNEAVVQLLAHRLC
jgi:hypothetical protein